jgi:hypothetical protein
MAHPFHAHKSELVIRVILQLAVYRISAYLGAQPYDAHDQCFFVQLIPYSHTSYVTYSLMRDEFIFHE